ncbi:hypothetical protein BT93_C2078 [Corymbia citriodora subsp. variegata]|nr:hypothetical protein BT93_C2078 [Corymbia citriodora subsp. variegata]
MSSSHVPKNGVDMNFHVSRMRTLLDMESNEVCMVGICGFGGIGKTTFARATYNAFAHKLECCSFLSNVRETCKKSSDGGLFSFKRLSFQVKWDDSLKLGNVHKDKSLITIENGKLWMHDMIQEMRREIGQRESSKAPGEHSILWFYEDVLHVLTEGMGTAKVEAIMLKVAALEEVHVSAQAFTNMKRLRIFLARNVYHSGDPIYFPIELRWLKWPIYSPPSEPFNIGHRKLVGLVLSKSSIRILGKQLKGLLGETRVDIFHPGSKIPKWFVHQSMRGLKVSCIFRITPRHC